MKNAYFVTVEYLLEDSIVKQYGPYSTPRKAEKLYESLQRQVDLDKYYVDWAWYGPNPEPTQRME